MLKLVVDEVVAENPVRFLTLPPAICALAVLKFVTTSVATTELVAEKLVADKLISPVADPLVATRLAVDKLLTLP